MKGLGSFALFALLVILDLTSGNTILGKFDTSSNSEFTSETSRNGALTKFEVDSGLRKYTSWEVTPENTCLKRVIVEFNGIETENKATPIDCEEAKRQVHEFQEKYRKALEEELRKVKEEQDRIRKEHAEFATNFQKQFNEFRSSFKF